MPLLFERQSGPTVIFSAGSSNLHALELADGRLLAIVHDAGVNGLTGRFFNAAGADSGTPFTLANHAPASGLAPLANGGFVLVHHNLGEQEIYLEFHDSTGAQVGSAIHVNTITRFGQYDPQVAVLSSGRIVVTWTDQSALGGDSDNAVAARLYEADGTPVAGQFLVNMTTAGDQNTPKIVALNNGGFVIGWADPSGGKFQIFDANGGRVGPETSAPASDLQLLSNGNFVATGFMGFHIYDQNGALIADLSGGDANRHAIGTFDGGFFVTSPNGDAIYDNAGVQQGTTFNLTSRDSSSSVFALAGGVLAFTGYIPSSAELDILKPDDHIVDFSLSPTSLSEMTVLNNHVASFSFTGGALNSSYTYSIVSDSLGGGTFRIEGNQLFLDAAGRLDYETAPTVSVTIGATDINGFTSTETIQLNVLDETVERTITGSPALPTLGDGLSPIGSGRFVSFLTTVQPGVGFPVTGQLFDADMNLTKTFTLSDDPNLQASRDFHTAALPSGGFVVTWGTFNGDNHVNPGVMARVFDANAEPISDIFLVNTPDSPPVSFKREPDVVALGSGEFVVAWMQTSDGDADGWAIRARLFNPSGTPIGAEFTINTVVAGDQSQIDLEPLASGGFLATWTSDESGPDDVKGQLFDNTASRVGGEFLVNTTVAGDQHDSATITLASGQLLVTWANGSSSNFDADGAIMGQLFDAAGARVGGEIAIQAYGGGTGQHRVVALPSGGFALAWRDVGVNPDPGDGSFDGGVWARIFNADGSPASAKFLVNTDVVGGQNVAGLAVLPDGELYVAWDSAPFTGSFRHARLFDLTGNRVDWPMDDFLHGTAGADMLRGGTGNDTYYVDNAGDVVVEFPNEGTDLVYTSINYSLNNTYEVENLAAVDPAATDPFSLTGNDLVNHITGNAGANSLDGKGGNDVMEGLGGNDTYVVDSAGDQVIEGSGGGADAVFSSVSYALAAGTEVETLSTLDWNGIASLNLTGNEFANYLVGNAGANILNGGGGADLLQGRGGNDIYILDNAGDAIVEAAGQGIDAAYTSVSYVLAAGVELETLSTSDWNSNAALNLTGNELANWLVGNAGANILNGGGGADILQGRGGNDIYIVDNGGDLVVENGGEGTDAVFSSVSYTLNAGSSVETLSTLDWNSTAALNLTGNELANWLVGNAGANLLNGGGGADILQGRGGNDAYVVDNAGDQVFENGGEGADAVYTTVSYALAAGAEIETLSAQDWNGTAALNLTGNEFANSIFGNAGANVLNGLGGADYMQGQSGNDTYFVDNAGDTIIEAAGGGADVVYATASYALNAGAEVETLSTQDWNSIAALDLTGNELANYIFGNAGANVLNGGGGNDALVGLGGADSFAFTTALGASNVDHIGDMVSGTDRIALDDAVFTGLSLGALNPNAFVIGSAAGDADDRIVYNSATGQLFFDDDGNGAHAAILFAVVDGHPPLVAGDFTVI